MRRVSVVMMMCALLGAPAVGDRGAVPVGERFFGPAPGPMSAWPDGEFVAVRRSDSTLWGQRYAADGSPLGASFVISSHTGDPQGAARVEVLSDGEFVVVWQDFGSPGDPDGGSIQGRLFTRDAVPVGSEFQVNTYTPGRQREPSLAALADGEFVVVWRSDGSPEDTDGGIQGQLFASDGAPSGDEFQVNSWTRSRQYDPAVAGRENGDFVVVWANQYDYYDAFTIEGRRFTADGEAAGEQYQINDISLISSSPSIATQPNGEFVVVWRSFSSSYGGYYLDHDIVSGRRLAADGSFSGEEFRITPLADYHTRLELETIGNGDFVVTWTSHFGEYYHGRLFAPDGSPLGSDLQIRGGVLGQVEGTFVIWDRGFGQRYRVSCLGDDVSLCLNGDRFETEIEWRDFQDNRGSGRPVPFSSEDSGLFYFFEADNWEVLLKVVDGCAFNDKVWVFAAATTNVEYTLRVRDVWTGVVREYFNPLGNPSAAITDVDAFSACP